MESTRKDLDPKLLMEEKEDQQDGSEKPTSLLPPDQTSISSNVFEEIFIQDGDLKKQIKKEICFFMNKFKKLIADNQSVNQIYSDADKIKALTDLINILPCFQNQLIKDLDTNKLTELKAWSIKESASQMFKAIIDNNLKEKDIENFKRVTGSLRSTPGWRTIIGVILGAAVAMIVIAPLVLSTIGVPIAAAIGGLATSTLLGGFLGFFSTKRHITESVKDNAKALISKESILSINASDVLPPELEKFQRKFIQKIESVLAKFQRKKDRYSNLESFFNRFIIRESDEVKEALIVLLHTVQDNAFFKNSCWFERINQDVELIRESAYAIKDLKDRMLATYCSDLLEVIGRENLRRKAMAIKQLRDSLNLGRNNSRYSDAMIAAAEEEGNIGPLVEYENSMRKRKYEVYVHKSPKLYEFPEKCDVIVFPSDGTRYRILFPHITQFKKSEGLSVNDYIFSVTVEQLQRLIVLLESHSLTVISPTLKTEEQKKQGKMTFACQ